MAATADSSSSLSTLPFHNRANPIDLTLDDDDASSSQYISPRSKRTTLDGKPICPPPPRYPSPSPTPANINSHIVISDHPHPSSSSSHHISSPSPFTTPYRPPFAGHNIAAIMNQQQQLMNQRQQHPQMRPYQSIYPQNSYNSSAGPSPSPSFRDSVPPSSTSSFRSDHHVIDLTSSPSPPPLSLSTAGQYTPPGLIPMNLNDPPKTPVFIGQLSVNALIMYPVPYTESRDHNAEEWAIVKLQPDQKPPQLGHSEATIHIWTPTFRTPNGDAQPPERFAFVEPRVAKHLAPMLAKGLIRFDARIRRGATLPIMPLQLLVYTPKGNIEVVGSFLRQCDILLDHPTQSFEDCRRIPYPYFNPHNPPPEGHNRAVVLQDRLYPPSTQSGRSQVDELFKNLKDGLELAETEPSPDVATLLYPHQKKALTFLLDREREKPAADGNFSSLWRQETKNHYPAWVNVVTEESTHDEPKEAKGAILADDMGLGKTITCVALIAATLQSAKDFVAQPLEVPQPPPPLHDRHSSLSDGWSTPEPPTSNKAKAKVERHHEKLEAEYVRASRIKARSRATLIICPLTTVSNWEDQFREHWRGEVMIVGGGSGNASVNAAISNSASGSSSNGSANGAPKMEADDSKQQETPTRLRHGNPLRVYIYHGNSRRPDPAFLADFDAVITTYATLASEFSKQSKTAQANNDEAEDGDVCSDGGVPEVDANGNPIIRLSKPKRGTKRKKQTQISNVEVSSALQSIHWFRVLLDEAHSIKETGTVGSRACCDLVADRRLCLTGTPVQNKLDDMFALIKFLRLRPFDDKNIWTKHISAPAKFGQREGVLKLRTIMACITLRRTKESKTPDGKRILSLPPRFEETVRLQFSPAEQEIYHQYFDESKAEFADLSQKNQVMKNYVGILQKLLRLRQICDHPDLVAAKGPNAADSGSYEEIVAAISQEGINVARASAIFAILREAATTQCTECGGELCTVNETSLDNLDNDGPPAAKRGRKGKGQSSRAPTRANSPSGSGGPRPVLTRCQHLFCLDCYRSCICPEWPNVSPTMHRPCSACQTELAPADAVEIRPDSVAETSAEGRKVKKETREERLKRHESMVQELEAQLTRESEEMAKYYNHQNHQEQQEYHQEQVQYEYMQSTHEQQNVLADQLHEFKMESTQEEDMKLQTGALPAPGIDIRQQAVKMLQNRICQRSSKIQALMDRLLPYSLANPHSSNYDPSSLDLQMVDSNGNHLADNIVKTVVFSQWTTMLDKIEDALLIHNIRYDRLDGTMKREERSRAMDNLKLDPSCEVLLVSLKAGGVGLNLTAAQRVILMDPYWNPAVENQAIDRIHRLGQTKPVVSLKFIVRGSIEEKMLLIQAKKTKLAEITLGVRSKSEIMQQRMDELKELFS